MEDNKKFWDKSAKLYTRVQEKSNIKLFEEIARASRELVKDKDVLELACGSGQITGYLYQVAKTFLATDYSSNMIEEAKKRNFEKVVFEVQDATNLTYEDDSFDVVIIANALHIMPNKDLAIQEIKRVLKKDGILIAPTFVYQGRINYLRLFIVNLAGFKTYTKWNLKEYEEYLISKNFEIISSNLIKASPVPEALVILRNKK